MTRETWGVALIAFLGLVFYASYLKQDFRATSSELALVQHEQSQLKDAKYSVERDISRAQVLQAKLTDDLKREDGQFRMLQSALDAIEGKVKSTDKLKNAVGQLKEEYAKLSVEIDIYHGNRK